jgi:hypothetical protein
MPTLGATQCHLLGNQLNYLLTKDYNIANISYLNSSLPSFSEKEPLLLVTIKEKLIDHILS